MYQTSKTINFSPGYWVAILARHSKPLLLRSHKHPVSSTVLLLYSRSGQKGSNKAKKGLENAYSNYPLPNTLLIIKGDRKIVTVPSFSVQ